MSWNIQQVLNRHQMMLVYMWTNLERLWAVSSYEGIHYNQYDQVALFKNMYEISYFNQKRFTFVMPLKWAAIIGYM